ncbi:MAG: tetratricopeptide repeat protein [bacterium]
MELTYSLKRAFLYVVISVFFSGLGCHPKQVAAPPSGMREKESVQSRSNVLLISIDTLRADHLGCYGYQGIETPVIDQLAIEGVRFTSCYTAVPITLPAHATLMTGQYPPTHGVRDNGTFQLGEESLTLAEIFKSKGYQTAAFVGAFVIDSRFGLDQGFDIYDDRMESDEEKSDLLFEERRGEEVVEAALEWLTHKKPGPFFLFIHCFDPHAPYHPPAPFSRENQNCDDPDSLASCYDQEIAYTDACLGRLFQKMKEMGVYDKTTICFTADHGEALGEHEEPSHSVFVYDSTLHIPLIVRWPGNVAQGEVIESQVSNVDIAPTLLALARIHGEDSMMQGRSLLLPKGADEGLPSSMAQGGEAIYCETYFPFYNHHWSPLQAVRTAEWKYIKAPRPELYHLTEDPRELDNLALKRQDQLNYMQGLFAHLEAQYFPPEDQKQKANLITMDQDTRKRLERLGYLWTAPSEGPKKEIGAYPDPKDMVMVLNFFNVAAYHYLHHEYQKAIELFQRSLEIDPKDVFAYFMIGFIHNKTGQFEKARDAFQECIRLDPAYLNAYVNLGGVYLQLGQREKAFQKIDEALQLSPDSIEVYQNLGILYSYSGEHDKAIEAFGEVLKKDANYVEAMNGLANEFLAKKDYASAHEYAQKVIGLDPKNVEAYTIKGNIFLAQGEIQEAEESIREALRFDPKRVNTLLNLADIYIQKQEYDLAKKHIAYAQEIDPNTAKIYNALGIISMREENDADALVQFQKAQQLEPGSAEIYYNMSLVFSHRNDLDGAIQLLQRSIELDPENQRAYFTLGTIFHRQHKLDQAIEAYQSALRADPDSIDTIFQMGLVYQDAGNSDQAIDAFKQVLSKDARHLNAHIKLSLLYFALGQTDLGIEECRHILEIDPANEAAHINLGFTFFRQKEFDQAILEYNQAIQVNPKNPVSYFHIATCYLWKQDIPKSVEYLKEALRIDQDYQPARQLLDQIQPFFGK